MTDPRRTPGSAQETRLQIQLRERSGVPFYRQIVDQISQQILSGQLKPNQALTSVRDLSKELVLSLITIRRAYADLEAAGLVVRRQGHGTYVAESAASISRDESRRQATDALAAAVTSARAMGLSPDEIDHIVRTIHEAQA